MTQHKKSLRERFLSHPWVTKHLGEFHWLREQRNMRKEHISPDSMYRLVIKYYQQGSNCWNYSKGEVFKDTRKVFEIKRTYSHFPFAWIPKHKNGHSYLLCGVHYSVTTVLELDTGKRATHSSDSFCWTGMTPSPDGHTVAVEGCYWASPYEVKLFDLSKPLEKPVQFEVVEADEILGWQDENRCRLSTTKFEWVHRFGKTLFQLDPEEESQLTDEDVLEDIKEEFTWNRLEATYASQ